MKGHQFFVNGVLRFPRISPPEKRDGTYRTVFGPSFSHSGIILRDCDENVEKALRRLTCQVLPLVPGFHQQLIQSQLTYFQSLQPLFTDLQSRLSMFFQNYVGALEGAKLYHNIPHPKINLRLQAWKELNDEGGVSEKLWLRSVLYKMKKNEIAKPNKYARMIADLGVAASLQGFYLTHMLKKAIAASPVEYCGGIIEFCPTSGFEDLRRVFINLLAPPAGGYYAYFSDDGVYAIPTPNGVRWFNIDIKSCDASHTLAAFQGLKQITPFIAQEDMQILIDQCSLPIRIHSNANRSNYVKLKPVGPSLYSGSTITTAVNGLAQLAIATACIQDRASTEQEIQASANRAGYLVTVETCAYFEEVQFLKHSPVLVQGHVYPLINMGVFLRLSGECDGDLPGRGSIEGRAIDFQAGLLQCTYPRVISPFIEIMRNPKGEASRFLDRIRPRFEYRGSDDTDPFLSLSDDQFYSRYQLTTSEIETFHNSVSKMGYNTTLASDVTNKILFKDYGQTALHTVDTSLPLDQLDFLLTHPDN